MSFHQPRGDKFVDQATQEEPYGQEGQYVNDVIFKYDEKLGYQLFDSFSTMEVLKLWLVEEIPRLPTEPHQKEREGNFN